MNHPMQRITNSTTVTGPHQPTQFKTAGHPPDQSRAAVILVHGRGATAQGMLQLAEQFAFDDVHYHALQAANYTWYPHSFLQPTDRNQPKLNSGLQAIFDAINTLNKQGISTKNILLMGFSQGACLSCEYAARHPQRYGGVVAFSGGLIGDAITPEAYSGSMSQTPVFLGCSNTDAHIPRERVEQTAAIFKQLDAAVNLNIYPDMGHTVNADEIQQARKIIQGIGA